MKLIHKFFLAFFITNITLVGLMFVFIYMNFASEFNNFVEKEEQQHLANVKQQLAKVYSQYNSWQGISQSVHLWRSIVAPKSKPVKASISSHMSSSDACVSVKSCCKSLARCWAFLRAASAPALAHAPAHTRARAHSA